MTVHFEVVFQVWDKIELYDSLEWYSERSLKTAENFSNNIARTVFQILESPTRRCHSNTNCTSKCAIKNLNYFLLC